MIEQVSKRFGDWADGNYIASNLSDAHIGRSFYVVDVVKTEAELQEHNIDTSMEYCGWTFVADDDGIEELQQKYHDVAVLHTYLCEGEA